MTGLFEVGQAACLRAEFLAVSDVSVTRKASVVVPVHLEGCSVVVIMCCVCEGGDAVVDIEGMASYGTTRL